MPRLVDKQSLHGIDGTVVLSRRALLTSLRSLNFLEGKVRGAAGTRHVRVCNQTPCLASCFQRAWRD